MDHQHQNRPTFLRIDDMEPPVVEARRADRVQLEGARKTALEVGRNRLLVAGVAFAMVFLVIAGRLVDLAVVGDGEEPLVARSAATAGSALKRADITDRNGVVLATSLPSVSLYADPTMILDADEAADKLQALFSDLPEDLRDRLGGPGRFAWIRRNLTPNQHYQVNRLGIPGLFFDRGERRVYPQGREAAHILGLTDLDGRGIAGVEKAFNDRLTQSASPLALSLDLRVQHILTEQLQQSVDYFNAAGAAGIVMDVNSGETIALASLPDFDPNRPATAVGDAAFNRATKGVYEMGSTFKLFTAAMALDSGKVDMNDGYDATDPIRIARFTINDFHAQKRWLSVPEILIHSSNIGSAKMAMDVGGKLQQTYLDRLGLLAPANLEVPEIGAPLSPSVWRDVNTMTISYGHGIAVSPLQLAGAVGALVNGGLRLDPTVIKREPGKPLMGTQVLKPETSAKMRMLMRMVVENGTGNKAEVPGYLVGGKTGTAEKMIDGRYDRKARISSFVGAFPIDDPRYVVLVVVDNPKGRRETFNYATGGWVAAPVVGGVVERMAPLMGLSPRPMPNGKTDDKKSKWLTQAVAKPGSGGRGLAAN